jgi:threonine dehydratase
MGVTLDDIQAARERIAPYIERSPVSESGALGLAFKWENHQRTHSFKPRGALNKVLSLSPQRLYAGLIAASAGNHGQGVALAAQLCAAKARIFVPQSTPEVKVARMLALGAQVERVPGLYGDAETRALAVAAVTGSTYVSPYNDAQVIAGAGTLALEWLEQAPHLQRWLVPLGGGGLIAGMGLVARALRPDLHVIGVQSVASPHLYQQFYHGHMDGVVEQPTLTDGLAGSVETGSITIDLLPRVCDAVVLVTEDEIGRAIAYAAKMLAEVIEGSAAVGLAAVLAGKVNVAERLTGALITGGNIDPARHAAVCGQFSESIGT